MDLNPNQFGSAGALPVYHGGINTGTNYGDNAALSLPEMLGGATQSNNPFSSDNDSRRRRRKKENEPSSVGSMLPLAAMAGTTAIASAIPNIASGATSSIGTIVGNVAKSGGGFIGQAQKAIGGGLEDLTIAAKGAGNAAKGAGGGILGALGDGVGALGKGLGAVGKGLGSAWDAIEPSGGFIGDIPENLGKGANGLGKALGSAWDAIEPSGGFLGDIGGGIHDFGRNTIKGWANIKEAPSDEKWKQEMGDSARSARIDPSTGKPQGEIDNPGSWIQTDDGGWFKGNKEEYESRKNQIEREDKAGQAGSYLNRSPNDPWAAAKPFDKIPIPGITRGSPGPGAGNFSSQFGDILKVEPLPVPVP
jgi:hypothetical protein